jgi:hypothetical protein
VTSLYPHLILISASPEASPIQDPDAGSFIPGEAEVIYYGWGDCQDIGEALVYGQDAPNQESEAVIFLAEEDAIWNIKSGMRASIVFDPETGLHIRDALVERVTIFDGTLKVSFL